MPFGLIARLRLHRRPAVMITAGLIAVQALLAGFVSQREKIDFQMVGRAVRELEGSFN